MDHVIGIGVKGVSRSIGAVSEVVAGRRRSSTSHDANETQDLSDSDEDIMSREQDLDDIIEDDVVASENQPEQKTMDGEQAPPYTAQEVADSFIRNHQTYTTVPQTLTPIPQPVILPQRRPRQRSRGFIRAYAPVLGECSGIDQDMFMDFLTDFDRAAKAWPIFNVINIAAFGIGLVPHVAFMAASTAMQVVATVGEEAQTRYTTNQFLDNVNTVIFKPRGLYCLIMTYKPDLPDDAILRADITDPHAVALSKALDRDAGNALVKKLSRFRDVSSGKARNDNLIPDPAPLVYPALDRALLSSNQNTITGAGGAQQPSSNNSLALSKSPSTAAVLQDYLDRRAQAQFLANHPDSKLASTLPPQKKFVNRFADPDHPVNSGSLFGLVTGGTWDPIASGRIRRAERKAKKKGEEPLTEQERHDAYMGRKVRGRVTGTPSKDTFKIKKMFGYSMLYLVIANIPEDAQAGHKE